jgi:para-nitrobenzyl esterase
MRVAAFEGIRYADAPTGEWRWKPPRPATCWTGVFNASQQSSWCMQVIPYNGSDAVLSEDCLFLNVYTPVLSNATTGNLPVLFWYAALGRLVRDADDATGLTGNWH